MTERSAKRLLILFSVAWMVAVGWFLFQQHTAPEVKALRQQQFERKMATCQGTFAERYDCTSALLRRQSSDRANWWAIRLLLVFGPPLSASAAYAIWWNTRERRREAERNLSRKDRLEHEIHDGHHTAEPPLREIDEIRRRADERRRTAKPHGDTPGSTTGKPVAEDHPPTNPATKEPPAS